MQNPTDVARRSTVSKYVGGLWGTEVRLVPKQTIPILTTPTRILLNNPRRFESLIINRGTGQVDMDWNPSLVLGDGVPLGSLGTLNLTVFEDGELTTYELWGISSAAGNSLAVYEVIGS